MSSTSDFLKTVRVFQNLTEEELMLLAPLFEVKNITSRTQIIRENDISDLFYVIRSGRFSVSKGEGETLITVLGPRDCFGEASLFHDVKRIASVTASEDSQILLLHRNQFQQFLLSYPIAANRILFQMLKSVFFRLQETNNQLQLSRGRDDARHALHEFLR